MRLGRYGLADLDAFRPFPERHDFPRELVTEHVRRLDPALRPVVPLINVDIGPANRCRFHFD